MESNLNLKDTELRLGLPGTQANYPETPTSTITTTSRGSNSSKHAFPDSDDDIMSQVVGWPPIRSYRRNNSFSRESKEEKSGTYVKVSMDGAPFLRKIDIEGYEDYPHLFKALEDMFKFKFVMEEFYEGDGFVPTYEDKDGDWMLVGDVPWEMFVSSCMKLRVVKGSEAKGLVCGI